MARTTKRKTEINRAAIYACGLWLHVTDSTTPVTRVT